MRVIRLARCEDRLERPICRECEASSVDQEFTGDIEEDQEEVEGSEAEDDIDLRNGGLLLEVLKGWVLRELPGYCQKLSIDGYGLSRLTCPGWIDGIGPCEC